jgi:DNA helicase-2/ATP-dependent DNA helicase PcrA
MKKQWVKDAAEELLQELYAANPNLADDEKQERRLRRQMTQKVVHKIFKPVTNRTKRFRFINYPKQYLHFLQTLPQELLDSYTLSAEEWTENRRLVLQNFRQKQLLQEDATLFFLLMKKISPVFVAQKARFIFIDEMQDFSPAQAALLQELYPKATYTFCGDLNQKVFGNETIVTTIRDIFPEQNVTNFQLTTSYRSTEEITDFANQFLNQEERVELTARKGGLPTVHHEQTQAEMVHYLEAELTATKDKAKYWRTAIIGKTVEECQQLFEQLSAEGQTELQLIASEDDFMKRQTIIIPAFLAKGLEFDRIYAWNIGADTFTTEQDKLILYTICTRAMHELQLLNFGAPSPILANVEPTLYETI